MQAERESKPSLMALTSSTDHSSELDRHQPIAGVVKRKRTKRPHHHPSASTSESTTTEEEDMAHCLILLAKGGAGAVVDSKPSPPPVVVKSDRYTSRKYTEAATTADGMKAAAGFYVYECKTCNKCFPTFQALGGHRASHKKPREGEIAASKRPMMTPPPPRVDDVVVTTALSLNSHVAAGSSNKQRAHECSICGAEFASGQALGGHMRRHRPLNAPVTNAIITNIDTTKKEGSASINLELDLNLPAPSDEEAVSLPAVVLGLGQFNDGNKAGLMLTASALVDCHY